MAFSRLYACDTCEIGEALLTFAEEWGADSPESAPRAYPGYGKIQGLFSHLWCATCDTIRPRILVHLHPSAQHAVVAYAEAQRLNLTGYETGPCPTCGNALAATAENAPCPKCQTGTLHLIGEWENGA